MLPNKFVRIEDSPSPLALMMHSLSVGWMVWPTGTIPLQMKVTWTNWSEIWNFCLICAVVFERSQLALAHAQVIWIIDGNHTHHCNNTLLSNIGGTSHYGSRVDVKSESLQHLLAKLWINEIKSSLHIPSSLLPLNSPFFHHHIIRVLLHSLNSKHNLRTEFQK